MGLKNLAYITGIAIGDGNLSNPNGRATRLRITCDTKYPNLIKRICSAVQKALPNNKVSIINRAKTYLDISCYSNLWEDWLGWKVGMGSKYDQNVTIPKWIKESTKYSRNCLRGLIETDGSIYFDRKYKMVNFTTIIRLLAEDVVAIIKRFGFEPHLYIQSENRKPKYSIRVHKNVDKFINFIGFAKD